MIIEARRLGEVSTRTDIPSSYGAFRIFKDYQIEYPANVIIAIQELCSEYNTVFSRMVRDHSEAPTDYQALRMVDGSGDFYNLFVQIDMAGLSDEFLTASFRLGTDEIKEVIRRQVFEIDDSLAMYNLMRNIHSTKAVASEFKANFDAALDEVRERTGRPIAVLATTEDKYHVIMHTELGITDGSTPSDEYVRNTIGFDKVFGPEDFKKHLNDDPPYLWYVRASPSVANLKNPGSEAFESELLVNHEYRNIIRANALTINVDNPYGTTEIVSDSKAALPDMGMGFRIDAISDFDSGAFAAWASDMGIEPTTPLRAKPVYGTYGVHGAFTAQLRAMTKPDSKLTHSIEKWGAYLIQPEIQATRVYNIPDETDYGFIDRLFVYSRPDGSTKFVGGLRNYIPSTSREAKKNNYHGNRDAVWGEIVAIGI